MAKLKGDAAIGHLLRRAGFGLSPEDAEQYRKLGFRGAVRRLLDELDEAAPADPAGFDAYEPGTIQQIWLDRMVSSRCFSHHTYENSANTPSPISSEPDTIPM